MFSIGLRGLYFLDQKHSGLRLKYAVLAEDCHAGFCNVLDILPKAPCSFMVDTWALKGVRYHDFGAYVYTIKLHGALTSGTRPPI